MDSKKLALIFIFATIAIDAIGLGIIIPSLPQLIADTAHTSVRESSKYAGVVLMIYAFFQFLFSPLIGNLSDRFGRKPIILMSLLGLGLDYVFMYFAPDLTWLIIGRALSGMFGASFTTAAAYIADISTDENRAQNFGMIGAAFGLGFVVGPAIGGLVADFGLRAPFLVAACFSLVNFALGLIFLKESLPIQNRRKFEILRANPIGSIKQIWKMPQYRGLFLVMFIVLLANMSVHAVWNYYATVKFGWNPGQIGISLAVVGISVGILQGVLAGKLIKHWGEMKASKIGILILIASTTLFGLIPYGWMMYAIILPYCFCGIFDPAVRTMVSGEVPDNEQGELQGIFTSLMSLAEIIGPPLMLGIFHYFGQYGEEQPLFYGMPFFLSAIFGIIAYFIILSVFKKIGKSHS